MWWALIVVAKAADGWRFSVLRPIGWCSDALRAVCWCVGAHGGGRQAGFVCQTSRGKGGKYVNGWSVESVEDCATALLSIDDEKEAR